MRHAILTVASLAGFGLATIMVSAQVPPIPDLGRQVPLPNIEGNTNQQGNFVSCPANSVNVGAFGTSAEGWSKPRETATLVDTTIMVVGGQKTLACIYRVTGNRPNTSVAGEFTILREIPGGVRGCEAVQGGFRCS